MGDRFYQQQKEHKPSKQESTAGIESFSRQKSLVGKPTKLQLCTQIKEIHGFIGVDALTAADLTKMLKPMAAHTISMPEGRIKKPYITECLKLFPEVSQFDKLTVAALRGILERVL